jgi:cyanophycinase
MTALLLACAAPVGPVYLVGGGDVPPELLADFIDQSGGLVVMVPTAHGSTNRRRAEFEDAGATVSWLHTTDADEADTRSFVEPLRETGGIWFEGGRQWRLVDAYSSTRFEDELHDAHARGAAIGGTSGGASILADVLMRGAVEGKQVVLDDDYDTGWAILPGTAVDQHIDTHGREDDLRSVVEERGVVGLGLDESTGVIVHDGEVRVVGTGVVRLWNSDDPELLTDGDRRDLSTAPMPR